MNQAQLDILNEIKVKMFYDPTKTLTEQTGFERQLDRTFSTPEGTENFLKTFQPYRHEIIQLAAFGSMILPYVGPVMSTSLELADAALYAMEAKPYEAGLAAALSMIGLPLWPGAKNYTKDFILKTIKKARVNARLTKEESEFLVGLAKNSRYIKIKSLNNLLVKIFVKLPLSKKVLFLAKLSKKYPNTFNLSSLIFKIGSVYISYNTLAKYFGILPGTVSDKEKNVIKNSDSEDYNKVGADFIISRTKQMTDEQLDSAAQYLSRLPE